MIHHLIMKDSCMLAPWWSKQWPAQEFSVPNCLQLLGTSDLRNGTAITHSHSILVCHVILQALWSCRQHFYQYFIICILHASVLFGYLLMYVFPDASVLVPEWMNRVGTITWSVIDLVPSHELWLASWSSSQMLLIV